MGARWPFLKHYCIIFRGLSKLQHLEMKEEEEEENKTSFDRTDTSEFKGSMTFLMRRVRESLTNTLSRHMVSLSRYLS